MSVKETFEKIVSENRSYRRFDESVCLEEKVLIDLISLARKTPSAANLQPLRYRLVFKESEKAVVFDNIFWAAYLKEWSGPEKGERPSAYIIMARESSTGGNHWMFDAGISAQTILLGAVNIGFGGCMIASFKGSELKDGLGLPENLEPVLVIALGRPVEKVVVEDMEKDGDVKYYRDKKMIHHVPKRRLDDLLI